ncbi:hypothetical protein K3495_g6738 [Podosphaera aphanis]|nr:hypothetical protein K3495_g6738 [Podosphaera aphanis]
MWLDRLAGHSTPTAPSPTALSFKNSHLAHTSALRPPRSSSLSVHSNETISSFKPTPNFNGSNNTPALLATDTTEPVQILESILSTVDIVPQKILSDVKDEGRENDNFAAELDFEGLSLQELATLSLADTRLDTYTTQTTEDYKLDKLLLEELHSTIRSCDNVLSSVESNLTSFQNDLAQVSAEIETLQARSITLSIRLENRKATEQSLGPIVEEISISPAIVRKIVDEPIDEEWVKALAEVEKRSKSFDIKAKDRRDIKGIIDLKPLLENLISKALERIRDFFVSQIKVLRSPNINAQIIQQQQIIRYKDLYTFLHKHHPQLAEEIGRAYTNTMRWYYLHQFSRYEKALAKIKVHLVDKHNVLAQDDGTRKSTTISGSKSSGPPHDAFNLGRRIDLLKASNQTALTSYLAEEDRSTHYLEHPFRNFNIALVDNASAEYSFLMTFFAPAISFSTITRHFNHIFEPTFSLGQALTKSLISDTYDCLGILICVRLNQQFAFELQRRKVPAMDTYINGASMLLWPRFQLVMDAHCESFKSLTSSLSSLKPSTAEAAKQSVAPHLMTQRFGQFLQGILALSAEAGDDEPVSSSLKRLRGEMEAFLSKVALNMDKRKRERFLFNNYSLILTIVGEVDGKLAALQRIHYEEMKSVSRANVT